MLHCQYPSSIMAHEAADIPERRSSSAVWTKRLKVLDTAASRPLFLPSAPISFSMLLTSNVASPGHEATADACSQPSQHMKRMHTACITCPWLSLVCALISSMSLQVQCRGLAGDAPGTPLSLGRMRSVVTSRVCSKASLSRSWFKRLKPSWHIAGPKDELCH